MVFALNTFKMLLPPQFVLLILALDLATPHSRCSSHAFHRTSVRDGLLWLVHRAHAVFAGCPGPLHYAFDWA